MAMPEPGNSGGENMYYHNKIQFFVQVALIMTCMVTLSGKPQLANAGQFDAPGLDGFNLHNERDADGDDDGVNETRIKHYLNDNGTAW